MALAVLGVDVLHQSSWNRALRACLLAEDLPILTRQPTSSCGSGRRCSGAPPACCSPARRCSASRRPIGPARAPRRICCFSPWRIDLGITNGGLNLTTDIAEADAAGLVHATQLGGAGVHRRTRARLHEHRRQGCRTVVEGSGGEHGGRRAHGAERRAADGAVGMARARGALLRSARSVAVGLRGHRAPVRARRAPASATRSCGAAASAGACVPSAPLPADRRGGALGDEALRMRPDGDEGVHARRPCASGRAGPTWQRARPLRSGLPDDVLRMASILVPAGGAGPPEPLAARIVEDGANDGDDRGRAADRRDSSCSATRFDPSWRATVDGLPAEIGRANGVDRGDQRVLPGHHVIRFRYRPRALAVGLTISGMAALALLTACLRSRRTRPRAEPEGFTLVELMIVMAILGIILAIAFARYRNMQARGNESSALASMRSIAAAQWSFALTCGRQKYAPTLPALGQPVPATGRGVSQPGSDERRIGREVRLPVSDRRQAPGRGAADHGVQRRAAGRGLCRHRRSDQPRVEREPLLRRQCRPRAVRGCTDLQGATCRETGRARTRGGSKVELTPTDVSSVAQAPRCVRLARAGRLDGVRPTSITTC